MPTPTRILIAISDFVGGGAERELSNLLVRIPRDRFEPHLCLWRPVFDYPPPEGIPVHVVGKRRAWDAPRTIWRTAQLIDQLRPDLVFSHLPYVSLLTGAAVQASRRKPRWIARLAGNPYWDVRSPLLTIARRVFRRADRLAGCSEGVALAAVEHLGVPAEKTCVLPNVVDVEQIERLASQVPAVERRREIPTLVHAGRLSPQKNQAMLLHAFSRLSGREAELWILGKGPLERRLHRLADRLDLSRRIRWLGFQKNPYAIFRAADCFVLTSDYEGMPNVVIEALMCGTPTASTDCPYGPRELIRDGVDGRLVPVGDAEALGRLLVEWFEEPQRRERLRGRGVERIRREMDPDVVSRRYCDLFCDVLEN